MIKRMMLLVLLCLIGCKNPYVNNETWYEMLAGKFYANEIEIDYKSTLLEYGVVDDLLQINQDSLSLDTIIDSLRVAASIYDEETLSLLLENEILTDQDINAKGYTVEDCERIIEQAYHYWIDPVFDNHVDVSFTEEVVEIETGRLEGNTFYCDDVLFEEDIIYYEQDGFGSFYRVVEVLDDGYRVESVDPMEIIEDIDIEIQEELDFSHARVIDEERTNVEVDPVSLGSILSNNKTINDYLISWRVLSSGIKCTISKKGDTEIKDTIQISNIIPSFKWTKRNTENELFYLKCNYTSSNKFTISHDLVDGTIFDNHKIFANTWQRDLSVLADKVTTIVEATIPIVKVEVPMTSAPYLSVVVELDAQLSATGEVSVSVSNKGIIGFEKVNGKTRFINDNVKNCETDINASLTCTSTFTTGVSFAGISLADLQIEFGIGATMSMIGHVKDSDGNVADAVIGLGSLNTLTNLVKGDENTEVLFCGDLSAHYIMKCKINSVKTLANRFGIAYSKSILNKNNAPLLSGLTLHVENLSIVDMCTWQPAKLQIKTTYLDLSSYSYTLNINERKCVVVTSLPDKITENDLVYTIEDSNIATVDDSGIITGISEGTTRLTVCDTNRQYQISAAILVKGQ